MRLNFAKIFSTPFGNGWMWRKWSAPIFSPLCRARFCEPKIQSFTKTDGLTFRVKEILEGTFKRSFVDKKISKNGAGSSVVAGVSPASPLVHVDTAPENVKTVDEVVPQGIG